MPDTDHTTPLEYRPIPECPGYRAGNDGSVWSCLQRIGLLVVIGTTWRRLKPVPVGKYDRVSIRLGAKIRLLSIHRLILEAFVGPCPAGMQACHLDDDPTNNRIENLRWDTPEANYADRARNGGDRRGGEKHRGEECPTAKLTEADVREIRSRYAAGGISQHELAAKYHMNQSSINLIIKRKNWAHVD